MLDASRTAFYRVVSPCIHASDEQTQHPARTLCNSAWHTATASSRACEQLRSACSSNVMPGTSAAALCWQQQQLHGTSAAALIHKSSILQGTCAAALCSQQQHLQGTSAAVSARSNNILQGKCAAALYSGQQQPARHSCSCGWQGSSVLHDICAATLRGTGQLQVHDQLHLGAHDSWGHTRHTKQRAVRHSFHLP